MENEQFAIYCGPLWNNYIESFRSLVKFWKGFGNLEIGYCVYTRFMLKVQQSLPYLSYLLKAVAYCKSMKQKAEKTVIWLQ